MEGTNQTVVTEYKLSWVAFIRPVIFTAVLIVIGVDMLIAGPRWRAQGSERWESRMHRRFGAGWNSLSEEERERFRAGMNHGRGPGHDDRPGGPASDQGAAPSTPPVPHEPREPR